MKINMLVLAGLFTATGASALNVYLKNGYGAEISYDLNGQENLRIKANETKPLGDVNAINNLTARTTGAGSSWFSSKYTLMSDVRKIKASQSPEKAAGLEPVIVINVGSNDDGSWKTSINWQPTAEVRKKFNERPDWRMNMIKSGMLGEQYKTFFQRICNATYVKMGSLCEAVQEQIKEVSYEQLGEYIMRVNKMFTSAKNTGLVQEK